MTILLETSFEIGDIVCSRLDSECTYIVNYYCITNVDASGTVIGYNIECSNVEGLLKYFRPYELEMVEKVKK